MPLRIPVSARAAEEIKQLALRFSKELLHLSGHRIRGRTLYDAFVKPLGYDSFNEVTKLSGRTQASFPMNDYLAGLKREIRKHLPVSIELDIIILAIDNASNPGSVTITIDAQDAPEEHVSLLTSSNFFLNFREAVFKEGRVRHIGYTELFDSIKRYTGKDRSGAIKVTLDYQKWPNEVDPLFSWERFDSFIRMIHANAESNNGVQIEILRVTRDGENQLFTGFNQHNIAEWKPYMWIVDLGHGHRGITEIFDNEFGNQLYDRTGNLAEAIKPDPTVKFFISQTSDGYSNITFGPSDEGKSFLSDRLNPFECASGLEVISLVREMTIEETNKWTPPEKVAGEMLFKAMAGVVDDFKAEGSGPLDFRVFCDWVGDIPSLLIAPWITEASRDSLTLAYEEAKAVDLITSLRINGLLPYAQ